MPATFTSASTQLIELPITPPTAESDPQSEQILYVASHVLSTEATALSHLSRLYATDPIARNGFVKAVDSIRTSLQQGGKLVVIGVGKSCKIGDKFVATMNSLGLLTILLHPVEALHGDLGVLRPKDIILMITYSGNTPELLTLLPYLPQHMTRIILTSHTLYNTTKLTTSQSNTILLPAPVPETEEISFGLPAPTTSTTVTLALTDALALAVSKVMHGGEAGGSREVFRRNHPGGAIGLNIGKVSMKVSDMAVLLTDIPMIPEDSESDMWLPVNQVRVLDCLLLAVRSPKGWLRTARNEVIPPRLLQGVKDPMLDFRDKSLALVVPATEWVKVPGDATIDEARRWIMASGTEPSAGCVSRLKSLVVGIVVEGKVAGVIEFVDLTTGR
ncbi:hypothetical protein BDZ91DRAFT_729794 [Kalaharituber pfeilii]|nr:hypothetical protein BDZ91DRAFT_729794 [Kalaharituber pfeilii]